ARPGPGVPRRGLRAPRRRRGEHGAACGGERGRRRARLEDPGRGRRARRPDPGLRGPARRPRGRPRGLRGGAHAPPRAEPVEGARSFAQLAARLSTGSPCGDGSPTVADMTHRWQTTSLWRLTGPSIESEAFSPDPCDAVVVGAGLTGLTT